MRLIHSQISLLRSNRAYTLILGEQVSALKQQPCDPQSSASGKQPGTIAAPTPPIELSKHRVLSVNGHAPAYV